MPSILDKFIRISPQDSENIRKQKILTIFLLGFVIILIVILIILFIYDFLKIPLIESDDHILPLQISILLALLSALACIIINIYISRILAGYILISIVIILIFLSDTTYHVVSGRSVLYFLLPIIFSAIIIKPFSSIIISLLLVFLLTFIALLNNLTPNPIPYTIFVFIGIIIYYSAKNIDRSIQHMEDANKRLDFYRDIFSHDIHNILQNIQNSTELFPLLLKKENNKEELTTILNILSHQMIRGTRLISNLEKLAQFDDEIPLKLMNINPILQDIIDYIKDVYGNREIIVKIDNPLNEVIIFANELITDVFENLLINAVIYNQETPIQIEIKITEEIINEKEFFKFQIIDNGIGISNDMKEKIFLRTFSSIRKNRGIGLGLSLVKIIIEKYNGHIWIENKIKKDYKKGSIFIFLLPKSD